MPAIRPVYLSGGSGTRLWPLSTPQVPKQFADVLPGRSSLFEATLRRLGGLVGVGPPLVVAGERHLHLVEEALARVGVDGALVLVEPEGRNTAPAVAAAALAAEPDEVLVILPADHVISDLDAFRAGVVEAVRLAESGSIVAFGVTPSSPDTGYGYIEVGDGTPAPIVRFKEKPDRAEAERLVADGRHLWNSGMFVARADTLLDEMGRLCPEVLEGVRGALNREDGGVVRLAAWFAVVPSISFDHAVMEHTDRGMVVSLDAGWDDVGSFAAVHSHAARDSSGNAVIGRVVLEGVTESLVVATSRVVAVAGVDGVAVVETPEAVLVVPLDQAQSVRELAERAGSA